MFQACPHPPPSPLANTPIAPVYTTQRGLWKPAERLTAETRWIIWAASHQSDSARSLNTERWPPIIKVHRIKSLRILLLYKTYLTQSKWDYMRSKRVVLSSTNDDSYLKTKRKLKRFCNLTYWLHPSVVKNKTLFSPFFYVEAVYQQY